MRLTPEYQWLPAGEDWKIQQIDVQPHVVGRARAATETAGHPAVGLVGSAKLRAETVSTKEKKQFAARGFCLIASEAGSIRGPAWPRAAAGIRSAIRSRRGVADFLVVSGNGFGHRNRRRLLLQEPARDFLSGADFGEGTEGGCIKIQGERFVVSVEFFSRRHSQVPFGRLSTRRDESVTSYRSRRARTILTDGIRSTCRVARLRRANPRSRSSVSRDCDGSVWARTSRSTSRSRQRNRKLADNPHISTPMMLPLDPRSAKSRKKTSP